MQREVTSRDTRIVFTGRLVKSIYGQEILTHFNNSNYLIPQVDVKLQILRSKQMIGLCQVFVQCNVLHVEYINFTLIPVTCQICHR